MSVFEHPFFSFTLLLNNIVYKSLTCCDGLISRQLHFDITYVILQLTFC